MFAIAWSAEDLGLLAVCVIFGLLAVVLFVSIFIADAREAKRRRDAKKAFERAQKYFARDPGNNLPDGKQARH
jgi:hypothetical protein